MTKAEILATVICSAILLGWLVCMIIAFTCEGDKDHYDD